MAYLQFSRHDVERLAQRLASPQTGLDDHERSLLLAIFSAAGDNVIISDPPEPGEPAEPTAAELQEQLVNAFFPGDDLDLVIYFRIGHPWPPPSLKKHGQ